MRTESFHADDLARLLRRNKIATMSELKKALGTQVEVTVFRKLKQLSYRSSYSHRSRYYTLDEIARFDPRGLWSFQSVWFSRQGTLVATAEAFVENSAAGHFVEELDNLLHVSAKEPLLKLVRQQRLARQPLGGRYLYGSIDPVRRRRQLLARRLRQTEPSLASSLAAGEAAPAQLQAAVVLFFSLLNEKQRRLYAGLESLKLGPSGDRRMAEFIGMDPHTVAKGRRELLTQEVEVERVRKAGGGRKPVGKKPRSPLPNRRVNAARHGRRPRNRGEVVPTNDTQDRPRTHRVGNLHQQEHGRPPVERHGLRPPRQP